MVGDKLGLLCAPVSPATTPAFPGTRLLPRLPSSSWVAPGMQLLPLSSHPGPSVLGHRAAASSGLGSDLFHHPRPVQDWTGLEGSGVRQMEELLIPPGGTRRKYWLSLCLSFPI